MSRILNRSLLLVILIFFIAVFLSFSACQTADDDDDQVEDDDISDDDVGDDDVTDDDTVADDDLVDDDLTDDDTVADDDLVDDDLTDDDTAVDDDTADDDTCTPLFPNVLVTGHRGATIFAPENTIPAIEKAFELGAAIVEVDVRHTADGEYVLMHDDTVDRTTNGSGYVHEMTLAEIKQLKIKDWMYWNIHGDLRVPTLAEALEVVNTLGGEVDIDMKTGEPEGAIQVVVNMGLEDICFVYSSNNDKLDRVRSVSLDVRIQPASSSVDDTLFLLDYFDPDPEHIEIDDQGFNSENVELIKSAGATVFMDALGVRDVFALLGFDFAWFGMMDGGVEIIQTDLVGALVDYRDSLCE